MKVSDYPTATFSASSYALGWDGAAVKRFDLKDFPGPLHIGDTHLGVTGVLNITNFSNNNPILSIFNVPVSATVSADKFWNTIVVQNDVLNVNVADTFAYALAVQLVPAVGCVGSRAGTLSHIQHGNSGITTGGDFIGAVGLVSCTVPNGGTNTGAGAAGTLYGGNFIGLAQSGATNYAVVCGAEFDARVASGASAKHRWGATFCAQDGGVGAVTDGAVVLRGASTGKWLRGLLLEATESGACPIETTGTILGTDGTSFTVANFADFFTYTFSGSLLKFSNYIINNAGTQLLGPGMSTKTGNYSVTDSDRTLIFNGSGTITLTLPAASSYRGRQIYVKTIAAQLVNSASSNVVPIGSATAGTAILTNVAGRYAILESDGTNWVVMAAN